jgi:hypothetical protein
MTCWNIMVHLAIISWVVRILTLLLSLLHATHCNYHDANAEFLTRIDALKAAADPDLSSKESGGAPTNRGIAGTSGAEALARGGDAARRWQRCSKCHARGHSTAACLTTDPASMRKRIAGNQKARRRPSGVWLVSLTCACVIFHVI